MRLDFLSFKKNNLKNRKKKVLKIGEGRRTIYLMVLVVWYGTKSVNILRQRIKYGIA